MANFITWLKDRKKENTIVPKTMTKAVYDDNGVALCDTLNEINNKLVKAPDYTNTIQLAEMYTEPYIYTADEDCYIRTCFQVIGTATTCTGFVVINNNNHTAEFVNIVGSYMQDTITVYLRKGDTITIAIDGGDYTIGRMRRITKTPCI